MTLAACAEIVQRGDPDRFLATMAAPPAARGVLFPLYAFNVEVSRAPWVTAEPMIAEMRLQWWRDALDEIGSGGAVRTHEVTVPLAPTLDPAGAALLDALVEARRADIEVSPFATTDALSGYLEATGGNLAWVAARALGAGGEGAVRDVAFAGALASYFRATAELVARGRRPLPDRADIATLAAEGLRRLRRGAPGVERRALPAVLSAWQAGPILRMARADPAAVSEGRLQTSEFRRRAALLWAVTRKRVGG